MFSVVMSLSDARSRTDLERSESLVVQKPGATEMSSVELVGCLNRLIRRQSLTLGSGVPNSKLAHPIPSFHPRRHRPILNFEDLTPAGLTPAAFHLAY